VSENNAPTPDPIRFFGTGWVTHDTAYWLRRADAACAGAELMRLAVEGVAVSKGGSLINVLLVGAIVICTAIAAVRTWGLLSKGRDSLTGWMADEKSVGPMLMIGFVGALVAYFLRSLVEAPGEAEKRSRYDLAQAAFARRRTAPATRGKRR
jgi:hypothetical protein